MKKIISVLVVLIMLVSSIVVYASETTIECTAETVNGVSYISGKIHDVSGVFQVSLVVGDINNFSNETIYYLGQTNTNEKGEFNFAFRFPGGTPEGLYDYYIGTNANTDRYQGIIEYDESVDYVINQFINADLDLKIKGYVPTISGSISCTQGKIVSVNILNKTDNTVIAQEDILPIDGGTDVSYTLPSLLYPKEYELSVVCTEGNKEVLSASTNIKSSGIVLEATGEFTPADDVEIDVQLKSEGFDLVDENKKITKSETFEGSIPNVVMSASASLDMQGYEIVWINGADMDDADDSETVVAKDICGGFETPEEISEVETNSINGSRKIVDNGYSGKFALEIKQRTTAILPVLESDYFLIANNSNNTGNYTEKANLITINVKPMYNAESISFYTKAKIKRNNVLREEYVLIKSDKDGDGVFEIGEDLSLGTWQELKLNLDTIEETIENKKVSGLYMKSNVDSMWVFDEIDADYRNMNSTEINLEQSAKGNLIYNNGLRFDTTPDGTFNTEAAIAYSGTEINGELYGIDVDSYIQNNYQAEETEDRKLLLDVVFSPESWAVVSQDGSGNIYENTTSGVSKLDTNGIKFKPNGEAEFHAGTIETEDRVKVTVDLKYVDGTCNQYQKLDIEMYEEGATSPYYTANGQISATGNPVISYILPKIRPNTVFKLKYLNSSNTTESMLSKFQIYLIADEDWNSNVMYRNNKKVRYTPIGAETAVTQMNNYANNEYSVYNKNLQGEVYSEKTSVTTYSSSGNIYAVKVVNLSNSDKTFSCNSNTYKIPYGENDIIMKSVNTITTEACDDILFVSVTEYSSTLSAREGAYFKPIEGMGSDVLITYDGNKIYYNNLYDNNAIYVYDISSKESQRMHDAVDDMICMSNDGKYMVYEKNSKYYLYDLCSDVEDILLQTGEKYSFNARGELFYVIKDENRRYHIYKYQNGIPELIFDGRSYAFDSSGIYLLINCDSSKSPYAFTLYKYYNGSYTLIETYEFKSNQEIYYLMDDLSAFYMGGNVDPWFDLKTGEEKSIPTMVFKAKDGTFITSNMELYNPATGEKYKITDATGDTVHYNPDTSMLTILNDGYLARCKFTAEQSSARYLLSFDGKNTWQSYKNGRWVTVSKGRAPTEAEIGALGMTGDELNNTSSAAYKKLYTNGTDILRVDMAIYMNSSSNNLTPVISKITVNTSENVTIRQMYSVRKETYNRADYANVSSIFPVEDFKETSECYYLFHLGKDKLYTYKGNELVEIEETEEELIGNMESTWIKFKQYAMNAKEVRNVPADVLTNLFVNPESKHTEFGVIYVLNGANNDANTVTFKIQANAKHINASETVIEVMMNGGEKKIINSREFNTEAIEKFLSWLEDRQVGRGTVFYIFKNDNVQFFINYYMIDSINVYNAENYSTEDTDEQTAVVSE